MTKDKKNKSKVINFREKFFKKRVVEEGKDYVNSFVGECPECSGCGIIYKACVDYYEKIDKNEPVDEEEMACMQCGGVGSIFYDANNIQQNCHDIPEKNGTK